MRLKISASRMGLARECLYWATPDVQWPPYDGSDAAEIGTWYHAVAAWVIDGREGDRPEPPACMGDACELTPEQDAETFLASLPEGAKIKTEVAYVYTPGGKARHLGLNVGRSYGRLADGEVPGSADVVVLLPGRAIVVDWKSGRSDTVDRARTNLQLAILAVCVAQYHPDVREVEVQLRYAHGWVDSHVLDEFALLDAADEIDSILASTNLAPRPGMHCASKYCPIRATCSATVDAIPEGQALVLSETPAIQTIGQAASLWQRAAAAQTLIDAVQKAVKTYVDTNGPVPLGDGTELACVDETRESIEATTIQAVYEPVQQWVTPEAFAECIAVSVPKTALEKAVKAGAERGNKGEVWDAALESLRVAGRLKSKTITRHRVRKVKP